MSHRGPLLTLLSGGVLAAVLLGLSTQATHRNTAVQDAASRSTSTAPSQPTATKQTIPSKASTAPAASKPPATSRTATFAGKVTGNKATVAISMKNGKAIAYLCDGNRTEAWLRGPASGGQMTLTGAEGSKMTATYGLTKAAGTVTTSGKQWKFDAPVVHKPSGLWRSTSKVRGAEVEAGWVVLADGTQVGVASVDGEPEPAPPFNVTTGTATIDGGNVTVAPADPTS
jgi:hypothetical protein